MRKNPARVAWTVLLACFAIFCLLAVTIPLALRWFVLHGEISQPGILRVAEGTILILPSGADEPIAVVDSRSLAPGTLIKTDGSSQGTLGFTQDKTENSPEIATVQVYPDAEVVIARYSKPRFASSSDPNHLTLDLASGRVRINASGASPQGLAIDVVTPHAQVDLVPGSYAVQVNDDHTQVSTRQGEARVEGDAGQVIVTDGLSTSVAASQPPTAPAAASDNLIANGDFQEPLGPPNWLVSRFPEENGAVEGDIEIETSGGRNVVRFSRINQPPTHTEVAMTQVLDQRVHDYETLNLQMDVWLRWQSLPGAGEQSSEFPLMFRLDYQDIYGNHQFWTHGFYYRDPPPQWVVTGGQKIPQNVWFAFESGNLFERLKEEGLPPPAKINYLKIYASGHNYDSQVAEVRLMAQ
jgi:hypothetical protein